MTRKKTKLEYITNDSARKATFKKRKKGLLKKLKELTTLCEVEACLFINSQYAAEVEAWPSPEEAKDVLERFMDLPKEEQEKKMLSQEKYLDDRIEKAKQILRKLKKENREKEINQLMHECLNGVKSLIDLSEKDRKEVILLAKKTINEVDDRIGKLEPNNNQGNDDNNNDNKND